MPIIAIITQKMSGSIFVILLIFVKDLLDKLSNLGIHNVMLGWIAAFLHERSPFVCTGTHTSTLQYINGGIPHGAKLG